MRFEFRVIANQKGEKADDDDLEKLRDRLYKECYDWERKVADKHNNPQRIIGVQFYYYKHEPNRVLRALDNLEQKELDKE